MWIGRADPQISADNRLADKVQHIADGNGHPAGSIGIFDFSKPDFRPAQVAQNGHRLLTLAGNLANDGQDFFVLPQIAVGEI